MKFKGFKPEDIDPEEIRRAIDDLSREPSKTDWMPGDSIEVTDGPFTGMTGHVESVEQDRQIVRAMIKVFGRETPVQLHFADLKPVESHK
jgi:transcriptional antiterminator NusG